MAQLPQIAHSPKGLQFITSVNTVERDEETRRKVRSHARRLQPKLALGPSGPASSLEHTTSQKACTTKFKVTPSTGKKPSEVSRPKGKTKSLGERIAQSVSPSELGGHIQDVQMLSIVERRRLDNGKPLLPWELPLFKVLPIKMDQTTEELFSLYHKGFLTNSLALNPDGSWFDSIKQDPAPLHAFFATMAALHRSLNLIEDDSCVSLHISRAIWHINQRLVTEGTSKSNPVSDGILVAVAMLVTTEAIMGSYEASAAHMNGLKMMVKLRGGLVHGLGYSDMLQRAISWSDFAFATAWGQPVAFPVVPKLAHSLGIGDRFMTRTTLASGAGSRLVVRDREVLELFEMLCSIVDDINSFENSNKYERLQICNAIYFLEWKLCEVHERLRATTLSRSVGLGRAVTDLDSAAIDFGDDFVPIYTNSIADDSMPTSESSAVASQVDMSEALLYAAHLFLHYIVRGQPPGAARHRFFVEKLWVAVRPVVNSMQLGSFPVMVEDADAISDIQLRSFDGEIFSTHMDDTGSPDIAGAPGPILDIHESLLLWILYVGACVRSPPPKTEMWWLLVLGPTLDDVPPGVWYERSYFVQALRSLCHVKGIVSSNDLRARLMETVWLDGGCAPCDRQLAKLWREIEP